MESSILSTKIVATKFCRKVRISIITNKTIEWEVIICN